MLDLGPLAKLARLGGHDALGGVAGLARLAGLAGLDVGRLAGMGWVGDASVLVTAVQ